MYVEKVPANSLFVSPEFLKSFWVSSLCGEVGEVWFAPDQPSHDPFGAYYGAISVHMDANLLIQDLHYLRQLSFIRNYEYQADRPYAKWVCNVTQTMARATFTTEVAAYLKIPGLREQTFRHEIWADRLPEMEAIRTSKYDDNIAKALLDGVSSASMNAYGANWMRLRSTAGHSDPICEQLQDFAKLDREWCRIWTHDAVYGKEGDKPAFRVVEAHMASPDRDATHQEWLDDVSIYSEQFRGESYQVPFLAQFKAYTSARAQIERRSGNAILLK